ncbi:prepilin-type N-terminal cleavage/methylation domain-containing protein [Rheinheimera sp. 4Y26]|uniref:prepilin-type N-terminal cleavage/methylation domain-containing protein n=1 Tax=Rheinheimera sp. 4Y26 TaxID=2977811 RepID=UPI0021B15448|nr:type II secretion system protein [Rheinheimera sp. 4Y26]MCT6700634.1 type II secretion system GspH family protein [Rheinheimera sp. 4Y26]
MSRSDPARGFTLIELLIVMFIMSISLSLVLPLTVDQVDKAKQRSERQLVVLFYKNAVQQAFFGSQTVKLKFLGKVLSYGEAERRREVRFEQLSFREAEITVTVPGVIPAKRVEVAIDGRIWVLELDKDEANWFNPD